jgi:hypothetical protein
MMIPRRIRLSKVEQVRQPGMRHATCRLRCGAEASHRTSDETSIAMSIAAH